MAPHPCRLPLAARVLEREHRSAHGAGMQKRHHDRSGSGKEPVVSVHRVPFVKYASRVARCVAGLALFGTGIAFFVRSELGVPPWDVLHQGIANQIDAALGTVIIGVGAAVLLAWIPLRIVPGVGTVLNAVVIGLTVNIALGPLGEVDHPAVRLAWLGIGMVLVALGSGIYINAGLGAGPRDGLMLGLNGRFGWSVRAARTVVEVTVLVSGVLLGGTLGLGTFVFALGIGPMVQASLALFRSRTDPTSVAHAH